MLFYQLCVTVLLLVIAVNFLLNLCCFRRPAHNASPTSQPMVSVLIPARNEENRIRHCLKSLLAQDHPAIEWIVLDDHSTDATAEQVKEFCLHEPRLTLIQGAALPEGWTGKSWACSQLAQAAGGDFLLFTDADTVHEKNSVSVTVGLILEKKADLLSLWPRQIMKSRAELLAVPFVNLLHLFFLPHWMPGRWRSLGAANGQFMLFRREAYLKSGGHERVRNHLVEDVALAREIKAGGMRLINANGCGLVHCRMYENAGQVREGFGKNLRAGCEGSVIAFLLLMGVQAVLLTGPFAFVLFVPWCISGTAAWLVLFQVCLVVGMRMLAACLTKQSFLSAWLHPVAQIYFLWIEFASWRSYSAGAISWKGRVYRG